MGVQLELDFEGAIAQARHDPMRVGLDEVWESFEASLVGLEPEEELRQAGEGVLLIAELLEQKAEAIYRDLRDRFNQEGPVPDEDFLAGLVQETMFLDVSGVVRQPKGRKATQPEDEEVESRVAEIDKTELLGLLEEANVEVDSPPALAVEELEYDENVGAWIQLIREFLARDGDDSVLFSELAERVLLTRGKAWLAILLGGFQLEQSGDFYQGLVRVKL